MTDEGFSDAEIIEASLRDGDRFREIFRRHHDRVYSFLARRVGRDLAADLASEVFVRAFKLRGRYDLSRPSCRPWLFSIAANLVGDRIRRKRIEHRQFLVWDPADDPFATSDERLAAWTLRRHLNDALASLRKDDRHVLLLHGVEEFTYQEIGEALGIPIGTVKSRLARARRQMKEQLADIEQIEPDGAE